MGTVQAIKKRISHCAFTNEYGHIDDMTPSFSIALLEPYRGKGMGTAMMRRMLCELQQAEFARASLSVQKQNPALHLYERLGFRIIGDGEDASEWLMVCDLNDANPRAIYRKDCHNA